MNAFSEKLRTVGGFIKKEPVLAVSLLAAVVSCFLVPPDRGYLNYIDFRTLSLLFCLMTVVEGLNREKLFKSLAGFLLKKAGNIRLLVILLVLMSFVSSMLITNDVALLTFVPFAVLILTMTGLTRYLIYTVVLQTVAANLGSMLTPVGNPQNLYLFSFYDYGFGEFLGVTAPVWGLSLILCVFLCVRLPKDRFSADIETVQPDMKRTAVYALMFILCLTVVFRLIPWYVMLAATVAVLFVMDRNILASADYLLLLTFVCFFIFSGNLSRSEGVSAFLRRIIDGRTFAAGVLSSQVISNVPAALLLAPFTNDARALVLGVNAGGLGTPIASMASLIGYRLYMNSEGAQTGPYMKVFLVVNLALLLIISGFSLLIL